MMPCGAKITDNQVHEKISHLDFLEWKIVLNFLNQPEQRFLHFRIPDTTGIRLFCDFCQFFKQFRIPLIPAIFGKSGKRTPKRRPGRGNNGVLFSRNCQNTVSRFHRTAVLPGIYNSLTFQNIGEFIKCVIMLRPDSAFIKGKVPNLVQKNPAA